MRVPILQSSRFRTPLRQRLFPAPFQIIHDGPPAIGASVIQRLLTALERVAAPAGKPVSDGQAKRLGNSYHRLRQNADQLARKPGDARAADNVGHESKELSRVLADLEIKVADPTGEPWSLGRRDFEQLGQASIDATITDPIISFVDCPAIWLRGKLIQSAKGLVTLPPTEC